MLIPRSRSALQVQVGLSAVAAATENDNDCKDDYPSAVIIKKMA